MMKQYDFIIVGGGIAGLYAAYKIKTMNPNASVIVLEKQHKKWAGGRTGNDNFRGTSIVTGAGIGRKRKDKLLIKLLKDMGVETHEFETKHNYAATIKEPCSVKNTFLEIKRAYSETVAKGKTFKEFTTDLGVDLVSFGGTKIGALAAEAVVVLNSAALAHSIPFLRKTSMQLPSKMRFVSVQLIALLENDFLE